MVVIQSNNMSVEKLNSADISGENINLLCETRKVKAFVKYDRVCDANFCWHLNSNPNYVLALSSLSPFIHASVGYVMLK